MNARDTTAPDLLLAIVAATRRIVAVRAGKEPRARLEQRAVAVVPGGDRFQAALSRHDRVNLVAECKRRSPSRGVLRGQYDPVAIARAYETGGAAAVSILTEPTFFDGSLAHLEAVRSAVRIPLLRKDFIVEPYQLLEARAAGADAVLIIVSALDDDGLRRLLGEATSLGLACLVEVHDRIELDRAVQAGASMVGVNNRNLRTLEVDLGVSEQLAPLMPPHVTAVAESGIRSATEIRALRGAGYRAFLVGEWLMTSPDPVAALAGLLAAEGPAEATSADPGR